MGPSDTSAIGGQHELAESPAPDGVALLRAVSLPMLVLYGLGTTIGAGIYALVGEVAGRAGMAAPAAFLVAALLAGTTGLGFAELAGRMPKAAGEAVFVQHAFGRTSLTTAIGLGVMVAGVVAAATISAAFGGYAGELVAVPERLLTVALVLTLGAIAVSGVEASVRSAAVFTVIEIVGLVLVVWWARESLADAPARLDDLLGFASGSTWGGILGGAFLAFFAFLGFEDMDSVAEETKDAPRVLPLAIVITLALTTVFYGVVSAAAVLTVDPALLAESDAPLSLVFSTSGGPADLLSTLAGLAMVNGVLVQLVMVPRVIYGMSNLGLLPPSVGAVSVRTRTPARATVAAVAVVAALSASFDVSALARLTSTVTITVFVAVNIALIVIKRRDGPTATFQVPAWLPWFGVTASMALFAVELSPLA